MRTTLNLPDALLQRLEAHARDRGETVTSVVERAMRDALDADDHERYREWRRCVLASPDGLGLTTTTASGFVRVITNPCTYRRLATSTGAAAAVRAWSEARGTRWLEQTAPVRTG